MFCGCLTLSSGFVTKHNRLLLDAVTSYRTRIVEEKKWREALLDNANLSILPGLKKLIETCGQIEGDAYRLLQMAVTEYRMYLEKLGKEPWVNKSTIKAWLDELNERDFREDLELGWAGWARNA